MCVSTLFYPLVCEGHWDGSHSLVIVNSAAVNIGVYLSFRRSVLCFFGYTPRSRITGSKAVPFLIFEDPHTTFHSGCTPTSSAQGFLISTALSTLVVCWFTDNRHSFFIYIFYLVTIVCIFSPSLHPTQASPTSLPHFHPPPWFCPWVLHSSFYIPRSPLSPPHSPLAIITLFLISMSLVIFCLLFSYKL